MNKRIIMIFIFVLIMVTVSACSGDKKDVNRNESEKPSDKIIIEKEKEKGSLDEDSDSADKAAKSTDEIVKPNDEITDPIGVKEAENEPEKETEVGDQIIFGSYEQDNDASDGKEDIEWIVLAKEPDRILVISKYGLDAKAVNENGIVKTWENSSLRKWLNEDFINTAFSDEEKERILKTTVIAEDNPEYGTKAGNDTEDKIFLLSISETEMYLSTKEDRICKVTEYAEANGNYYDQGFPEIEGKMVWMSWLRSPGARRDDFANISYEGEIIYGGAISGENLSVRPAMWIGI